MENEQKVYGNMLNKIENFSTRGTLYLGPHGGHRDFIEISWPPAIQNQYFDVVKLQNKLFQRIWLILTLKKML